MSQKDAQESNLLQKTKTDQIKKIDSNQTSAIVNTSESVDNGKSLISTEIIASSGTENSKSTSNENSAQVADINQSEKSAIVHDVNNVLHFSPVKENINCSATTEAGKDVQNKNFIPCFSESTLNLFKSTESEINSFYLKNSGAVEKLNLTDVKHSESENVKETTLLADNRGLTEPTLLSGKRGFNQDSEISKSKISPVIPKGFVFGSSMKDRVVLPTSIKTVNPVPETVETSKITSFNDKSNKNEGIFESTDDKPKYSTIKTTDGEECDKNVIEISAHMYMFENSEKNWKSLGIATVRLNDCNESGKDSYTRIIIRMSKTGRLLVNSKILKTTKCEKIAEDKLRLGIIDFETNTPKIICLKSNKCQSLFQELDDRINERGSRNHPASAPQDSYSYEENYLS